LTGTLPSEWSAFYDLVNLDLSGNSALSGSLPAAWSALTELTALDLSDNALTGTLPLEWSGMPSLVLLDLSLNQLTGTLPSEWSALSHLATLDASSNMNLTGAVPDAWAAMAGTLTKLDVDDTGVCYGVPASLKNITILSTVCYGDLLLLLKYQSTSWPAGATGWEPFTDPCEAPLWTGVTCSSVGGVMEVTSVNVSGFDLTVSSCSLIVCSKELLSCCTSTCMHTRTLQVYLFI
jgi:hypothetical protein